MSFVAKSEIARWPFVGWLAARAGTIFHQRGSTDSLAAVMARVVERLREGMAVGVFPEGGSGHGDAVGTFHARIFQTALDANVPVQPVALRYGRRRRRIRACRSAARKVFSRTSCACSAARRWTPKCISSNRSRRAPTRGAEWPKKRAAHRARAGLRRHHDERQRDFVRRGSCAIRTCSRCSPRAACAACCSGAARGSKTRADEHILDCGDGVRLQGFHTRQRAARSARRWSCCCTAGKAARARITYCTPVRACSAKDSTCSGSISAITAKRIISIARSSIRAGSTKSSVRCARSRGVFARARSRSAGISLGGNFALRVALRAPAAGIALDYVLAVCPAISPRERPCARERVRGFTSAISCTSGRVRCARSRRCFPKRTFFARRAAR